AAGLSRERSRTDPREGGDKSAWRRKPRAGRRRAARNANADLARQKRGRLSPPFHFSARVPSLQPLASFISGVAVPNPHAAYHVPRLNLVDDLHAGDHAAKDGVLGIEVRLR